MKTAVVLHVRRNDRASWDHGSRTVQMTSAHEPLDLVRLLNKDIGWRKYSVLQAGQFVTA